MLRWHTNIHFNACQCLLRYTWYCSPAFDLVHLTWCLVSVFSSSTWYEDSAYSQVCHMVLRKRRSVWNRINIAQIRWQRLKFVSDFLSMALQVWNAEHILQHQLIKAETYLRLFQHCPLRSANSFRTFQHGLTDLNLSQQSTMLESAIQESNEQTACCAALCKTHDPASLTPLLAASSWEAPLLVSESEHSSHPAEMEDHVSWGRIPQWKLWHSSITNVSTKGWRTCTVCVTCKCSVRMALAHGSEDAAYFDQKMLHTRQKMKPCFEICFDQTNAPRVQM